MSVSAVIPAYNAEAFLREAIDSVLGQTVPIAEIIVVDDGSKDATCVLAESYGARVRLLRQQNQGPSVARNLGVQSATSEYIAFLDADDAWHPQKIEKQLAALAAAPDAVLCYTGLLNFRADGWKSATPATPPGRLRAELLIRNPRVVPSCVLVSRAAFVRAGGFDPALKGSEDWDFVLAMLEQGALCTVEAPLTRYRVSTTGLSGAPEHMFLETKKMLDRRLLSGMRGAARRIWRRRILSFAAYSAGLNARNSGMRGLELRFMVESIFTWPSPGWHGVRYKALAVSLKNWLLRTKVLPGAAPIV